MAIQEQVENEYGATFNYHKIKSVRIDADDNSGVGLSIIVYSWLNKQCRIEGKKPSIRKCSILQADFALTPFYELLKAKFPEFAGGDDDFDNSFKSEEKTGGAMFVESTGAGELIKKWNEEKGE